MKVQKQLTGLPLLAFGFVHVTNLPTCHDDKEDVIRARTGENGRQDHNNGMDVAITLDGEVWLRAYPTYTRYADLETVLKELCPNKGDAFVPCSNGEAIPSYLVFKRVSDPYWDGGGKYPCEPQGVTRHFTTVEMTGREPAFLQQ